MATICPAMARIQAAMAMPRYFLAFDLLSRLAVNCLVFVIGSILIGDSNEIFIFNQIYRLLIYYILLAKYEHIQFYPTINSFYCVTVKKYATIG